MATASCAVGCFSIAFLLKLTSSSRRGRSYLHGCWLSLGPNQDTPTTRIPSQPRCLAQHLRHYHDVSTPIQFRLRIIADDYRSMGVVSAYGPNRKAAAASYGISATEPIRTSGYWPQDSTLIDRINGLMNGVFAYGGATLFNELMAEMRRP